MNSVKERDKSYKRKSYLNRSRHAEAGTVDLSESRKFSNRIERHLFHILKLLHICTFNALIMPKLS